MLNITATQTEAIVYTTGRQEVMTSEGRILFSQTAFDFNSALWTESSPSAIFEVSTDKFDFLISPNPVSKNKLTIKINSLPAGEYQIEIYNTLGNLIRVKSYQVSRKEGTTKFKIKVGDYMPGTYFVRLRSGNQVVEKKFIKN